jgi:hypothetical protein
MALSRSMRRTSARWRGEDDLFHAGARQGWIELKAEVGLPPKCAGIIEQMID